MKYLIEIAKMSGSASANVVVTTHRSSNDTGNEPPSVSVTVVKPYGIRGLEHGLRYLDQ